VSSWPNDEAELVAASQAVEGKRDTQVIDPKLLLENTITLNNIFLDLFNSEEAARLGKKFNNRCNQCE